MIKANSRSVTNSVGQVLKWGTIFAASAIVMMTYKLNAEAQSNSSPIVLDIDPAKSQGAAVPWTPAAGFADLIEQVSPSVVHVSVSGVVNTRSQLPQFNFPEGSPFDDFFEQFRNQQPNQGPQESRPLGIGSGFIISADGFVVTNNHVISDADEIVVTTTDGKEYVAELKGTDSKTDLALLKLSNVDNLPYVKFGDADKSRVGDWVVAIGNPFGLGGSASTGIISARGRDINSGPYDDYIQVDAAINRGNSGGPLFNLQGEVIGINTAIYSPNGGSVGIGFSIPSNLAGNVIAQLKESGIVERAYIGVEIQSLDEELAEGFGRSDDSGALVASVVPGKPADKAGIQAGDIILSFNGNDINEMRDLPKTVAQSPVGEKFKVDIWRNGKSRTVTIETERFPEDDVVAGAVTPRSSEGLDASDDDVFGARLSELDDDLRRQFDINDDIDGIVVLEVDANGLASRNGVRRGDVITSVNNEEVDRPRDVRNEISDAKKSGKDKIVVLLQRNNGSRFIPFNLAEN
ncbi:MAG: Do family serine endopeptidase [Acidiferrobacterales bacterium]|nr:Do family serine endopeptidase [Acidiferrobacterales bacterium]